MKITSLSPKLLDKLRIGPWLILAIITTIGVGFLYPHQLGVLLWSLTKLCWGAYLGYWIDRSIFPYARPDRFSPDNDPSGRSLWELLMLRRAIIIAAAVLALGLGV
ncbi:putative holin [Halomonas llamarensis]|uniref:Holin n=1 Tax=Halomonas llamarensis TaxID=2945104 RepID=A0ABT0SV78_9GAMM|nr:putative holin [Halomonas llamarensis]